MVSNCILEIALLFIKFSFRIHQIVVLSLLCSFALGGDIIDEKMVEKINTYNLCCECFGEEFVDAFYQNLKSATKKCGGAMPHDDDDDDEEEEDSRSKRMAIDSSNALTNLMAEWNSKMGNLTCVLKELKFLNEDGDIDMEHFTVEAITKRFNGAKAASDPVFVQKLSTKMNDCHAISESWPESTLQENDFKKKYGRHMTFFSCCMKSERELCMKYQMAKLIEKRTGEAPSNSYSTDKYDAAAWNIRAMRHEATPEAQCIDEFFWNAPHM